MALSPETLDAMLAAGLTSEQIVAVTKASLLAEATETEAKRAAKRANNAERQRRWRDRHTVTQSNALSSVTERDGSLNDPEPLPVTVENNLNPPKEKDPKGSTKKVQNRWPGGSFDRIWAAFPHKVGKKAVYAKLALIERSGEATPEEILDGIERYKLAKPEHHDWANPLTWLNQGRWADEYGTPPGTGPPMNGAHSSFPPSNSGRRHAELHRKPTVQDASRALREWAAADEDLLTPVRGRAN